MRMMKEAGEAPRVFSENRKDAIHFLFPATLQVFFTATEGGSVAVTRRPQAGHIQGAARPCGSAPTRGRAAEQGVRFPEEPAGFSSGGASEAGWAPDNGAPAKHCPKPWCSPGRPAYRILFRDAIRRQESPPTWAGSRRQRALRSFSARSASRFISRRAASSRLS